MRKRLVPFLLVFTAAFTFSQTGTKNNTAPLLKQITETEKRLKYADALALKANDDSLKTLAYEKIYEEIITRYRQLLPQLSPPVFDSLFITASTHAGILHHYFDSTATALQYYLAAIKRRESNSQLPDTMIFQPLVFAGSLYYSNAVYDSSLYYLKKAEAIKSQYSNPLNEEERLYNLLGVTYYENGNLKQSLNYVQKALSLLTAEPGYDKALAANFQMNIASILIKLEEYTAAEQILVTLKENKDYPSEVLHKLGYVKLKEKKYQQALRYFNDVMYSGGKKQADLYINKAMAWKEMGQTDSAWAWLLNAKAESFRVNGNKRSITNGTLQRTEADLHVLAGDYNKAVQAYQLAIINYCTGFTDSVATANPENFTGAFAYIDLFNTLIAKGDAFTQRYNQTLAPADLEAATASYKTAYQLAGYVEKTYASDEARLFLNNLKYNNHSKPIDVALKLHQLTNKKKFLEEAYYFDQQNKASILAFNIRENELKSRSDETNRLLQQAAEIKSAITRLSIKAGTLTDSSQLNTILNSIQDYEIELSELQEKIKKDPAWQQLSLREQVPSVSSIQKKMDNTTALISWHLSEIEITALVITRGEFTIVRIPLTENLLSTIDLFKKSLHDVSGTSRFTGTAVSKAIYQELFKPLQPKLTGTERLIIIPDDELHYLPFEALQDAEGNYLLQQYAVQYLWSASLFQHTEKSDETSNIFSVAPFSKQGFTDSIGNNFSRLAASGNEVGNLPGLILVNEKATKQRFLANANQYPVIHLATHASVDNQNPDRSFVAFYPDTSDYKLYAKEIYNLRLDSTSLLILSACETGTGQLVRGEGLMSLSRAFAYAGCSNIITSLWKAEDNTTSYLTQKIHFYLSKGMTKDRALRQAKLDLITDKETDPRYKTPNYWAHLLFIGNYETSSHTSNWPWIAVAIILIAFFYSSRVLKKSPAKKTGLSA